MKHYLKFDDGKSDKFWQIETARRSFTVTYGRTGTRGVSQTKSFASEQECNKEAEKLIKEKLKKGYCETDVSQGETKGKAQSDHVNVWQAIVTAKDLRKALIAHFSYLADNTDFESVLTAIMNTAQDASVDKQKLIVRLKGTTILEATAPAVDIAKRYPETYKHVLQRHEKLSLNSDIILGNHECFEPEWLEEVESELLEITKPEKIISPLWHGSDCWVYHPKEKNAFGEPLLYFLSHEGGDIENPEPFNIGSFFLSQVAETLKLKVELPLTPEQTGVKKGAEDWQKKIEVLYDGVARFGRNFAKPVPQGNTLLEMLPKIQFLRFENLSTTQEVPFEKMTALKELNIFCPSYGKKIPLTSIEGIENASGLEKLQLFGHKLTDITKLRSLNKLVLLSIASNKLKDISILTNFLQLEEVNLNNNPVSDITPLANLPNLKTLSIQSTNVTNLSCLIKLKNLKNVGGISHIDQAEIDAFKKNRPDVRIF